MDCLVRLIMEKHVSCASRIIITCYEERTSVCALGNNPPRGKNSSRLEACFTANLPLTAALTLCSSSLASAPARRYNLYVNISRCASDIDLVVSLSKPVGFAFMELADHLEQKIGRKIDLITTGELELGLLILSGHILSGISRNL